jgi:small conductance mechanosensitive channel
MAHTLVRIELEAPVRSLLGRMVEVLVLGLFILLALQNLGVELLPLIAGLGIVGAGVALATQGVLGDLVAGLTIMVSRPFRVGDYISIVKEEGTVQDITLGSTTLGHGDLSRVVIPNRKIVGEILHNYGRIRQLSLEVGISYDSDVSGALDAIREVLRANPRVLQEPAPGVQVARLAESAIAIAIAPWVQVSDYGAASGEINQAIVEVFRSRSIALPVQREDWMDSSTAYLAAQRAGERFAARDAA